MFSDFCATDKAQKKAEKYGFNRLEDYTSDLPEFDGAEVLEAQNLWKENKDSRLAKLMTGIFKEQNGLDMKVETIHAGLECGWHFLKNPKLDMVSIGVTTKDIHSPNEKLLLDTVEPQVHLILETLHQIAERG